MTKSCASGSTAFTPLDPADCGLYELEVENLRALAREVLRDWRAIGIELVCPEVDAAFTVYQLHFQPAGAALEDVPNTELAADLLWINRFTLVGEAVVRPITKLSTIREKSVVKSLVVSREWPATSAARIAGRRPSTGSLMASPAAPTATARTEGNERGGRRLVLRRVKGN